MLHFVDPRAPAARPEEPYTLALPLRTGQPSRLAFLANGFPDSENFLAALAAAMRKVLPGLEPLFWNKGNASIAAPADMLEAIREQADGVVAAYGH